MYNNIHWLNAEKTTLVLDIPQFWGWDEMHAWLQTINKLLTEQPQSVSIVVDFQNSTFVPNNAMMNTHKILQHLHPQADPIILTGLSSGHRAILDTLFSLHPHITKPLVIMDNPYDLGASA